MSALTVAFFGVSTLFWTSFLVIGIKDEGRNLLMWPRAFMAVWSAICLAGQFA